MKARAVRWNQSECDPVKVDGGLALEVGRSKYQGVGRMVAGIYK